MSSLNIIGAGQVGKALGYLFHHKAGISVLSILNRSIDSAKIACEFIGAGIPVESLNQLLPADCFLIASHDQQINALAMELARSEILKPGNIVFHCSGSLSSEELIPLKLKGASIASLHPIQSFIDPQHSVNHFVGTFCGLEGDDKACELLSMWIEKIGGKMLSLNHKQRSVYHAASVIACSYLVAITEAALNCFKQIGIQSDLGLKALAPIMRLTLENTLRQGTQASLTGPIARGETEIVKMQINELTQITPELGQIYKTLGKVVLDLVAQQNTLSKSQLELLHKILNTPTKK